MYILLSRELTSASAFFTPIRLQPLFVAVTPPSRAKHRLVLGPLCPGSPARLRWSCEGCLSLPAIPDATLVAEQRSSWWHVTNSGFGGSAGPPHQSRPLSQSCVFAPVSGTLLTRRISTHHDFLSRRIWTLGRTAPRAARWRKRQLHSMNTAHGRLGWDAAPSRARWTDARKARKGR